MAGNQNLLAMRGLHMSKAKVGIALGLIVMIGCSSSATVEPTTPTPTPDIPQFAEGEAIAVVKMYLRDTNRGITERNCLDWFTLRQMTFWEDYLGNGAWLIKGHVETYVSTPFLPDDRTRLGKLIQRNNGSPIGITQEELNSAGISEVTLFPALDMEWRVYENSLAVNSQNEEC